MNLLKTITLSLTLILSSQSQSVPMQSHTATFHNANGTSFIATYTGDEYLVLLTSNDGTILVYNKQTKNYMVAQYNSNTKNLEPSAVNYPLLNSGVINAGLVINDSAPYNKNLVTNQNLADAWNAGYSILNTPVYAD